MAENARVVREQRRLETKINVPVRDENLYTHALRSRNKPYDMWQRQLNIPSNRGKQTPNIPPRWSSVQTNHQGNTSNIQTKLQVSMGNVKRHNSLTRIGPSTDVGIWQSNFITPIHKKKSENQYTRQ